MTCTHTTTRWEETRSTYPNWDGEYESETELVTRSTMEDIDTHRMRCSLCGEIGYYSGAARRFYEKGERSPGINGLE